MSQLQFRRYRSDNRYTHYLFRFPAKFHPPAVRCLIDRYSKPGNSILDPFCGSGTLLVEALVAGRDSIGLDIDPLAAFISRVKSSPVDPKDLQRHLGVLLLELKSARRTAADYDRLMHDDISARGFSRWRDAYGVPSIPRIEHWFRHYIALDLARLRSIILRSSFPPLVRNFFLGCFAGIIRNASNADPVPVSGLEVTSHMLRLNEEGRRIDPFELFERRARREIEGMEELWKAASGQKARVLRGSVTALRTTLRNERFDTVITSPPYNTAVDYYRRHMLEMYWLGLVDSHEQRLALARRYVGRAQVRKDHPFAKVEFSSGYVQNLIRHAAQIGPAQERAVTHYCASMEKALNQISKALKPRGTAVLVVGNAKWNGKRVRASKLLIELAQESFELVEQLSYPAQNRYMSYQRHNGADVNREYVVALRTKKAR